MTEKPILFSAPMVRALLAGTKTQTRRALSARAIQLFDAAAQAGECHPLGALDVTHENDQAYFAQFCPYGQPGDRLWVRETFAIVPRTAYRASEGVQQTLRPDDDHDAAIYRAGWTRSRGGLRWRPSIHMPRWASRITLEVTEVRVERLQDISDADAIAEGIEPFTDFLPSGHWRRYDKATFNSYVSSPVDSYASLWESINGAGSWKANPWVWAVSFRRITP